METKKIMDIKTMSYHLPDKFKNDIGKLIPELGQFLSSERFDKIQKFAKKRSRKVLTVFENTHHAHNISAILRSVDSFGFLDLFFIYSNPEMRFRVSDAIDRGSSQWLFPKRFNSISSCAEILKKNNYKIALVSLPDFSRTHQDYKKNTPSFSSSEFSKEHFLNYFEDHKVAIVFGSELMGLSSEWGRYVDMYVHVNMFGFTESLNVSVCAGILLQSLRQVFEEKMSSFLVTELEEKLITEHWVSKDYNNAYRYISDRKPELIEWFEFVRAGKFFL